MITGADIAVTVASELTTAAAAHEFSADFTPKRVYVPLLELPSLKDLSVLVMAKAYELEGAETRHKSRDDFSVDVGVTKKITNDPSTETANEELDDLVQLVTEIAQFYGPGDRPGDTTAFWVSTKNLPIYDVQKLKAHQTFQSVITFTFRLIR
jgi:hypothetical protein